MARVISVSNHKGGVGKTTVVANLGFALARFFKVLLVDLDPQANLSTGLGFDNHEENLAKYFKEVIHFRSSVAKPYVINDYVHIIPGRVELLKIEKQLPERAGAEHALRQILSPLKNDYDIILLDCPPSFSLLTINALSCSNLILVPAKPEMFSMNGVSLIKQFADENEIPFKLMFNQVNLRFLLHQQIIQNATEQFTDKMLAHTIRNNIALAEAFEHAKDIFHYKRASQGASDFIDLADELIPYI